MNSRFSSMRLRWTLAAAAVLSSCVFGSGVLIAAQTGSESLGDGLLEDLDPGLFAPAPASPESNSPNGTGGNLPKRVLPGIIDDMHGEDLGATSASAPLVRVVHGMTAAAALVRGGETIDEASGVQREVVAELDKLIEQLSKQCSGGACQGGGQPKPQSQRSQASSGKKGGAKPGRGNAPARESSSQLRQGDPGAVNLAEREQLMKDLWGHLPPQVREQVLESSSDEFLPEYADEIEAYFRTLAEEPTNRHVN